MDEKWRRARGVNGEETGRPEEGVVAEARERYARAVEEAGKLCRKAVSTNFEDERTKMFAEFREFLGSIGCRRLEDARGVDVVAFIQGWWLPGHEQNFRTRAADGGKVASASAVKAVIGHVAKSFSVLGFKNESNPGKNEVVRSYREGYRADLRERGVRERRAKVMSEGKVKDLVEYLNKEVKRSSGLERCVAAMDRAIVLYLWETWARGKECGEIEMRQVDSSSGVIRPGWSKTMREEPSAEISVTADGAADTFLWAATALVHKLEKFGVNVGDGFLFRPVTRRRDGFETCALSSGAMNRRIQRHMQRAGVFNGETLHSFRRSAAQHAAELEGYDVAKLMARGRWKSRSAFRVYVEEIASNFARGSL